MKTRDKQVFRGLMSIVIAGAAMGAGADAREYNETPILAAYLSSVQNVKGDDAGARGKAVFYLSNEGEELHFRLDVSGIKDVTSAYIHMKSNDGDDRVVVTLCNITEIPPRGTCSDSEAEGIIKKEDLVGPLVGSSLAALLREMEGGHTYVTVHSKKYPLGHLRGPIAEP